MTVSLSRADVARTRAKRRSAAMKKQRQDLGRTARPDNGWTLPTWPE